MLYPSALLFLLAGIGVVNGLLLGAYLVLKPQKKISSVYFGGMLLAISIRIGKSVLIYFTDDTDRLIMQIGLSACIFAGPLYYLFVRSRIGEELKARKQDLAGLVLLLLLVIVAGWIYPYRQFPDIWNGYFIHAIYGVWALFCLLGLYEVRHLLKRAFQKPRTLDYPDKYVLGVSLGMLFISCTYFFALYIKSFTYLWGSLIFSLTFYYLMALELRAQFTRRRTRAASSSPLEDLPLQLAQLDLIVDEQALFKNPKLKLAELAAASGLTSHQLSRLLNESHHHGFANYINEKRVLEARKLIRETNHLSLEGIGYEAGFNSKSTFFATFRKQADMTPAQYKKETELMKHGQKTGPEL